MILELIDGGLAYDDLGRLWMYDADTDAWRVRTIVPDLVRGEYTWVTPGEAPINPLPVVGAAA